MYLGWNDYELIYLIKEGNEKALNLMYQKYTNFIKIKARELGFKGMLVDDCVQEGLMVLTKAIKGYNEKYNKSFWSYYNLILNRRLWRYAKEIKLNSYEILNIEVMDSYSLREQTDEYGLSITDPYLKMIYEEIYYFNTPVNRLANKLGVKPHKIYRDLKKIREILRLEFDL